MSTSYVIARTKSYPNREKDREIIGFFGIGPLVRRLHPSPAKPHFAVSPAVGRSNVKYL
jgi:hypothetical protein